MYPSFKRELASVLLKVVAFLVTILLLVSGSSVLFSSFSAVSDGSCNIAVYPIDSIIAPFSGLTEHGEILISPNAVREFIKNAENDYLIDAIVFELNSPGGTPVASEWITDMVTETELPTVALIGDIAASGGYMIASAADHIVASAMSDVGSIGVTMSYLEESKANEEEGLSFVELATGKFKDAGNPNKPLSEEERALFESQLGIIHDEFVEIVSENRSLELDAVKQIADGSTMIGKQALEAGLVDEIGGRKEVRRYLAETLGKEESDITFCEYIPLLPF